MGGSNMAINEGTAQIRAPYFVGVRTGILTGLASPNPVFALRNIGMAVNDGNSGVRLVPTPLPVAQIRLRYAQTTAPTALPAFEVFKVSGFTAQLTGGVAGVVQRRKTTGYPAIAATEVDVTVANTGTLAGGTFVAPVALNPFDMGNPSMIWRPDDTFPLVLEQDEGILIRVAQFDATGILFIGVDFGR